MRRIAWLSFALLLLPAIASAKQPKCPLPLDSCIVQFGRMHDRPFLGVNLHPDSTGGQLVDVIDSVKAGGAAERAGWKKGDRLVRIDDRTPLQFFIATRAGWKDGDRVQATLVRKGHERDGSFTAQHIPEELFARIVGEHMIEAHLAYMDTGEHDTDVH
jgi:predicted metalloprotease with PDZ domain